MFHVTDTGFLRSEAMAEHLRMDSENMVVVPEAAQWECYGGANALVNITKQLRHVSKFPRQVLVLRSVRQVVAGLDARGGKLTSRDLVDWEQSEAFPSFCRAVGMANKGDLQAIRQIRDNGTKAREQISRLREAALQVAIGLKGIAKSTDPNRLARLRRGEPFNDSDVRWYWESVMVSARAGFDTHPDVTRLPSRDELTSHWLFRYAAAGVSLQCWWLSHGGFESTPSEKLANDISDVAIVTAATYFDGLLSSDARMTWVHEHLKVMLTRPVPE